MSDLHDIRHENQRCIVYIWLKESVNEHKAIQRTCSSLLNDFRVLLVHILDEHSELRSPAHQQHLA